MAQAVKKKREEEDIPLHPPQGGNENLTGKNIPQGGNEKQTGEYSNVERLRAYLKANRKNGITQAEVARRIEYSSTAISQYLGRKYDGGDIAKLDTVIGHYLDAEQLYITHKPQIESIAMTRQATAIMDGIHYGVAHRCFVLIVGDAGIGKTATLKEYWRSHLTSTILLTLDPLKQAKTTFIQYLWSQIPGMSRNKTRLSISFKFDDIVFYLKGKNKVILIDDAQWLNLEALETARSIQDQTAIPIILAGTFSLDQIFGMNGNAIISEQLHSRVLNYCRLKPGILKRDLADVIALYDVHDPAIVDWFYSRGNRAGRRYRWICAILDSAYGWCIEQKQPMGVEAVELAAIRTGLYEKQK